MIKVLHIFGKMNRGGAEMRTLEILPSLKERGVHFDFCTLGDGDGVLDDTIRQSGSKVLNCPLSLGTRRFSKAFCGLLKSEQYDVVHSHVYYFSGKILQLAHKVRVCKRIAHFRTIHDGKEVTWKRRLYHAYMKYLLDRHATDILAVCKGAMDSSWEGWQSDPRCKVIYNGINLSRFTQLTNARERVCEELGLDINQKILIHVGSFNVAKAHDILLEAMSKLLLKRQDVQLLLAGEGVLKEQMCQKAKLLKIDKNVHFMGLRDDVPRLLKAADCFVLSSRREGLPGVVLEAVAAGLPVVATDLPGTREIADYSSAVKVVEVENPEALSEGIQDKLELLDSDLSISLPEIFDLKQNVDEFHKVYQRELEKH